MLKIGYFFEHPSISGAEGSALELFNHINRNKFSPVLFAPPGGELELQLNRLGFTVRKWQIPRGNEKEKLFSEELTQAGFDLLHANTMQLGRLTGRLSSFSNIPAISHVREFGTIRERMRKNLSLNKALIAVSKSVRSNLIDHGIPSKQVHVIYNGVSYPHDFRDCRDGIRKELDLPTDAPLVAWLGQITIRKSPGTFTEAAKKTILKSQDIHFLLMGDVFGTKKENIDLKTALLKEISRHPLKGRLHFLGWRTDATSILRQSTVLLHTALQEPLSRVLLEALAAGTAIVATRVGGTPEAVGDCGVLVEPRDIISMTENIIDLINNPMKRQTLEKKGKSRWKAYFMPQEMSRKIMEVWEKSAGINCPNVVST